MIRGNELLLLEKLVRAKEHAKKLILVIVSKRTGYWQMGNSKVTIDLLEQ